LNNESHKKLQISANYTIRNMGRRRSGARLIHLVLGMALRSRCERLKSSSNLESRRAVGLFGLFGA
jgi:hypothetical protein